MKLLSSLLLVVLITTLTIQVVSSEWSEFRLLSASPALSRSAPLKPLTPIAGTNLVLNTPYKWQDRTKPGCYVTWLWEKYADWSGEWPGAKLLCNQADQQWYDTKHADWVFERSEGPDSMDVYDGPLKIKNIGHNDYLKTWKSTSTWWVGLAGYGADPAKDLWNVRSDPSDKNNLQFDVQNWFIAQSQDKNYEANHRMDIYLKQGDADGFPYSFVPSIDLEAKMYDFVFVRPQDEELARHTSQKSLVDSYSINNDSPGSASRTIVVSETVTDEFSFGFSESFKYCVKVSVEASIPFVAKSTVDTSVEIGFSANQQWKSSVQKKFEMKYDITVPANTEVTISAWYELIKGISMDYTATTEITGKNVQMSIFDDLVRDSPATGEMIRRQLDHLNFDGKVIEVRENSVIAEIKGTMVASIGVRGQLSVNGNNVNMSDIPL